jgi:hypothetical protein
MSNAIPPERKKNQKPRIKNDLGRAATLLVDERNHDRDDDDDDDDEH